MANEQDDFVTIRPRQVVLSHQDEQQPSAQPSPQRVSKTHLSYVALALLLAFGAWVFLFLPGQVSVPERRPPEVNGPSTTPAPPAQTNTDPGPAPYQQLQHERERKRAQETLARFVELQIQLEDAMHVENWADESFKSVQELANEGDELFTDERYDEAIGRYQEGITALEALVGDGEGRFSAAIAEGQAALRDLDPLPAVAAFDRAAIIYPEHPEVLAGLARAATLPEVIDGLEQAAELRAAGQLTAAREAYLAVQALDPATPGISEALEELNAAVAELQYQSLLSAGYAALNERRFSAARKAFNEALARRPGSSPARAGLEQVAQASTLSRIDRLRNAAAQHELQEQWADARTSYEEVLGVDSTLKFARDGRQRAAVRAKLDDQLIDAIAHPERLSSDETFGTTVALYQRAVQVADPGSRLTAQIDQLEAVLAVASEPVPVTLLSDNATEITVFQVGYLGTFETKRLSLRPGRYVIKGSRNGCRDVRVEVDVAAQMDPLDVRCLERL